MDRVDSLREAIVTMEQPSYMQVLLGTTTVLYRYYYYCCDFCC